MRVSRKTAIGDVLHALTKCRIPDQVSPMMQDLRDIAYSHRARVAGPRCCIDGRFFSNTFRDAA